MSVLSVAKEVMTEGVRSSTSGLKLVKHIEEMVRHQDIKVCREALKGKGI